MWEDGLTLGGPAPGARLRQWRDLLAPLADLTLVDPAAWTTVDGSRLCSKQRHSPWQGQRLRGAIRLVVLRGEVIARDGAPVGTPRGRLVRASHTALAER